MDPADAPPPAAPTTSHAPKVAAGILASRLVGFLRERAVAYYFGIGPFADVFRAALRAPNLLQNLLGEGTLSASFIPIYVRLLEEGRPREAGRFAGAVLGLLAAVAAAAVLVGILLARPLVALLTPGFTADAAAVAAGEAAVDRYALAVTAVRIIFPMTGLLVLSAWALGVLNSHRRFFLPYAAPVLWSSAIIASLVLGARSLGGGGTVSAIRLPDLLVAACFGALAGGLLQLAVQLPLVFRLMRGFRLSASPRVPGVRDALAAFGPVVAGRGVVQVAGYLDLVLASLLTAGAVAALGPGQYLYMLPVSLFGMSVAAAELPELSRAGAGPPPPEFFARLESGLRQMAFFTVPTAAGYLAFGFLVVGTLYRTGRFGAEETWLVYLVLAGYSLGLPATASSRLLQNAFYALRDTRTPARIAVLRVVLSAAVAVPLMLWLDRFPVPRPAGAGGKLFLGAVGLSLGSAVGAWTELGRLRAVLGRRLPGFALPLGAAAPMAGLAAGAAVPAAALWLLLPPLHPAATGGLVVSLYAAAYLGLARLVGRAELTAWLGRLRRR